MIKGITAGQFLTVTGGSVSSYISTYSSNPGIGNMRYNTNTQNIEVYDGVNWQMLTTSYANVELNGEAQSLLIWAREERANQLKRQHLIKDNPALQKAYEAIKRAEANFDILEKFVENDYDNDAGQVQASP